MMVLLCRKAGVVEDCLQGFYFPGESGEYIEQFRIQGVYEVQFNLPRSKREEEREER